MRIAFLMRRSAPDGENAISPIAARTIAELRTLGAEVDVWIVDDQAFEIGSLYPAHDLYVLKSKVALTLSVAGALALAGATVVNSFRSHNLTWDKLACTALLAAAGVQVPPSYATARAELLHPLTEQGALWVKPQRGKQGTGVRRITRVTQLAADEANTEPLFAQSEVPSDGRDFKVYVIGDKLWSLAKPWPPRNAQDKIGTLVPLPPDIRDAAVACGRGLGLELYGVDFMVTGDQFSVIDVNPFPGYHGVPDAPRHLAEYIHRRAAQQHMSGVPIPIPEVAR